MFKSIKNMLILGGSLLILAGCAGNGSYKLTAITECYFPDAPSDKAPLWVCGAPVDGLAISGVGIAQNSKAGIQFMELQGSANARVFIAQELKTKVTNQVKSYVESKGLGDDEAATATASSITSQFTEQNLVGAKIYRYVASPKGTMYVLVGLNQDSLASTLKQAVDKANVATPANNQAAPIANPADMTNSILQNFNN
ncbi:LPP20 family lipoprotein [Rickettsiales bacterium LUAb2]